MTNNSGATRAEVAAKLVRLGIEAVEEDVITSGYAAAVLVADYVPTNVFVIGSEGLRREIAATGADRIAGR